jgi:hypothetical protein
MGRELRIHRSESAKCREVEEQIAGNEKSRVERNG